MARKAKVDAKYEELQMKEKIASCRNKLYSEEKKFNCFEYFGSFASDKIKEMLENDFPVDKFPMHSLKRYLAVASYLGTPKAKKDFVSFDDRMAFLIMAIDPELSIYYFFLNNGYSLQDSEEVRLRRADSLITFVRNVIGAFDGQFLKYEEMYFGRVLKESRIISFVNKESYSKFFNTVSDVHSFRDVTLPEFQDVSKQVKIFFNECQDPTNINSICFNVSNPNTKLELYGKHQRAIFVIQAIDPDLNALKIWHEEADTEVAKRRIMEAFGFYHDTLIKLEESYDRRFGSQSRISEVSQIKTA